MASTETKEAPIDLATYKEQYVPTAQGFVNLGATCYFNSLMQCILSCPVIFETLKSVAHKEYVSQNRIAMSLIDLWESALRGEPIQEKGTPIWKDIIALSRASQSKVKMDYGQQDANEGLMLLLDSLDKIPEFKTLFQHRQKIQIICPDCKKVVCQETREDMILEAQADLKVEQLEKFKVADKYFGKSMNLNDFILYQNGYVDANHICSSCNKKVEKFKITELTMSPEILVIVLKKYRVRELTPFPMELFFPGKEGDKKMIYRLVAQSEYSGVATSGHYWAICKRSDGWKNLNDSNVSDGIPGPTPNSYMLFYNFIGMR